MFVRFATSARSVVLATTLVVSCGSQDDTTSIAVVVDTDYGFALQAVVAAVHGSNDEVRAEHRFENGQQAWPLSFGVVPHAGESFLEMVFTAQGPQGLLSKRRVEVDVSFDQSLSVPVFLDADCRGVSCPDDETCTELGCRPPSTPVFEVEPGHELEGLCRPGEAWCDHDASTLYVCEQFGFAATAHVCTDGCDPGAPTCADGRIPNDGNATVTVSAGTNGRVVSAPAGIVCGSICSATFIAGARVWLQALPDEGYAIDAWSTPCFEQAGRSDICELEANGTINVEVTFRPQP